MKNYWLFSGIILATILITSCPMPLDVIDFEKQGSFLEDEVTVPDDTPSSEAEENADQSESSETVTPGIGTDSERNQGVYINEKNEIIDIRSMENGFPVACVEAVDIVFLENPETAHPARNTTTKAVALVIGERDDGKPGLWEIHNDSSIHPVTSGNEETSLLPESEDYQDWMMAAFGWEYHVTGISSDGRIIIGYAVNTGGWNHHYWNIEEGTSVGVYWALGKRRSGRIPWVSRAKVIGTPLQSFNWRFRSDKFGRRAMRWLRFLRSRLQLLFLDWMENYLTMTDSVAPAEDAEHYIISGPDKSGINSAALVNWKRVKSIEPLAAGDELDLSPGALIPADYNAADGEELTVNLTVENFGTGIVTGDFDIQFFLSGDTTFNSEDTNVGTISVTVDIPGSSSIDVTAPLTIPETDANETFYIFAFIDSGNSVNETNEDNNYVPPALTPAILVYNNEDSSRTYTLDLETFPPTGTAAVNPDTWLFLYDDTSGETLNDWINENDNGGIYLAENYSGLGAVLSPGTYYVLIIGKNPGPYALSIRTSGRDIRFFENEHTKDPYEDDDSYTGHIPDSPVHVNIGEEVNRYSDDTSDFDWFSIVLP